MSYSYSLEELIKELHNASPAKADGLAFGRKHIHHGLLPVGLKIHCLADQEKFAPLFSAIKKEKWKGGNFGNHYRQKDAEFCLVLPPVGSADAAITLIECIEGYVGVPIFNNTNVQLQICSPSRLVPIYSALLAIGFYLSSDKIREYSMDSLETTFTSSTFYPRARRIVLYDAHGDFDREFEWWRNRKGTRRVNKILPFKNGRSDILAGIASRWDIYNINLIATLLVHAQYYGFWRRLGLLFVREMQSLLERHGLAHLLNAAWVHNEKPETKDDYEFFAALQQLVGYASEKIVSHPVRGPIPFFPKLFSTTKPIPIRDSSGILSEMGLLLQKYRSQLEQTASHYPPKGEEL